MFLIYYNGGDSINNKKYKKIRRTFYYRSPGLSADEPAEHSDTIAFFDEVGTIPWTRSIRESKENCFPDINIPRILLLMAWRRRREGKKKAIIVIRRAFVTFMMISHSQELSFISLLSNFRDQSSPLSNSAAKLPLTTFGDIGELASNKLAPKLLFQFRVSVIIYRTRIRETRIYGLRENWRRKNDALLLCILIARENCSSWCAQHRAKIR